MLRPITVIRCWSFLILVLSAQAVSAAQPTPINIAYTSISPQYSPVWLANDAGIFRKNGIEAKLVYMRGGILATQALVSNDVNFICAGGGGVIDAVLGGADIFIIASPVNQEPQVLVSRRDIKEITQVKGKKLAVNSLAGPAMISLKMILAAFGLDPDRDVSYLATGPSGSRYNALQLGHADATTLTPPFITVARKAGFTFFENLPGMKDAELPNASLITSRRYHDSEPAATEQVVKSVIEAIHYFKTERAKTMAIMRKYTRIDSPEELRETYDFYLPLLSEKPYPKARGIQTLLDWSKRNDARKARPEQFMNTRVIEKLDKQGFIDGLYKR